MIRVAVAGAGGKMGRSILHCLTESENLQLVHAFDRTDSDAIGTQHGNITITDTIIGPQFDVLIEFTRPEATCTSLDYCTAYHCAMIVGTTGLDAAQQKTITAAAKIIPIVQSSNMSIGVNALWALLAQAARMVGRDWDIEILEAHHNQKVDAPSGTALTCGQVITEALDTQLDAHAVYARHGNDALRTRGDIGFQTVRGGDIVGEHTALFIGAGERIELTHRAHDRAIFARGALRAAAFVADKAPGLYSMGDVLQQSRH